MQQLQATLDPPAPPEIPAKRLLDLQIKIGKAEKEQDRLKSVHDKKQEELMHEQMRLEAKMSEVREVLAAIEEVKKEMDIIVSPLLPRRCLKLVRWMRKKVLRMTHTLG